VYSGSGQAFSFDSVSLPADTSVRFVITAQISPAATGVLVNPVSANLFFSVLDPNMSNNIGVDSDTLVPQADLKGFNDEFEFHMQCLLVNIVIKTVLGGGVIPGQLNTFSIKVFNLGPSDAPTVQVNDAFPAILTNVQAGSCIAVSPSSCSTTFITSNGLDATANIKSGLSLAIDARSPYNRNL